MPRRTAPGGCTRCHCFLSANPKVHVRSAVACPPRFRARPEGRMFPLDGNADGPPCCPRKSCPVSRRRCPWFRGEPRGVSRFTVSGWLFSIAPERAAVRSRCPLFRGEPRRVSRFPLGGGAAVTDQPEGLTALDPPKAVEDLHPASWWHLSMPPPRKARRQSRAPTVPEGLAGICQRTYLADTAEFGPEGMTCASEEARFPTGLIPDLRMKPCREFRGTPRRVSRFAYCAVPSS